MAHPYEEENPPIHGFPSHSPSTARGSPLLSPVLTPTNSTILSDEYSSPIVPPFFTHTYGTPLSNSLTREQFMRAQNRWQNWRQEIATALITAKAAQSFLHRKFCGSLSPDELAMNEESLRFLVPAVNQLQLVDSQLAPLMREIEGLTQLRSRSYREDETPRSALYEIKTQIGLLGESLGILEGNKLVTDRIPEDQQTQENSIRGLRRGWDDCKEVTKCLDSLQLRVACDIVQDLSCGPTTARTPSAWTQWRALYANKDQVDTAGTILGRIQNTLDRVDDRGPDPQ